MYQLFINPTKIYTSYSRMLISEISEKHKKLSNFHLQWFLLKYIKILCILQGIFKILLCGLSFFLCHVFNPGGTTSDAAKAYLSNHKLF